MKTIFLTSLFLSTLAFAHQDHDWREDYEAYLSVEYQFPLAHKSIQKMRSTKRLDMSFFKEKLIEFASSERQSTEGLNRSREFLKAEYEKLGFTVSFQEFGKGINFIAEKSGDKNPGKVLILSSHIDTVRTAGANDNGTGTIGLLTVARELAKNNYSSSIRILGFDKEEIGLRGSDAYVATLNKESILGNINFEMMGVNKRKDGGFHVIDCNKENSLFLSDAMKSSIADLGLPLVVVKACTDRSDHASFWRKKLPAIVISENFFGGDADPCYHAKCDVVDERLNYEYMGNILEATLEATERIIK